MALRYRRLYNQPSGCSDLVFTRRIVVSSSNARRLEEASAHLRALAGRSELLVLAETRGAADDFARSSLPSAYGVHRLTLRQFAAVLATEPTTARGLAPVSRLGMEAIAARSVHACRVEGSLHYFAPVADTPGFPRALARTLNELRLEGVSADRLTGAGTPGADLARLLECYEKELVERSLADMAMIFRLATDTAIRSKHRLTGLPIFLLDCAMESAAERTFVAALVRQSPEVVATVPEGAGIEALEEVLQVAADRLDDPPASVLGRVQRFVFASSIPAGGDDLDNSLEFFSAAGEGLECVEIARRIRLLAEQGVAFDRMAILLRNPPDYLPLVEDALRRAGIPAYFTRSANRPDPAGRAFLALLACAVEGLTASRFAEYLSLGQVPQVTAAGEWVPPQDDVLSNLKPPPTETPEPAPEIPEDDESPILSGTLRAPFDWEKLLVDAAVIGGRDRWSRRLRGLEAEFRLQLEELRDEDAPRREHIERQLQRLGNLERFALPVIEFLGSLPKTALWKEWLAKLAELARMVLRRPDSVLSVLSELQPMGEVGPVTLDEIRGVLSESLRFLQPEPQFRRYGRVFVGAAGEARGRSFEIVFLPGLAEGLFPRRPSEDPLLLDEQRRKLDAGLALLDDRVAEERLLLRNAAGAARTRLVASYPRMDVTIGRPRVPSFYALEIWRAAEGRLPDLREMEKRAAQAAPSQLGWPAPSDTGEAIDDAEYDLAFLDGLLRDRRTPERGASRYLLGVNPHLARSLRTRWRRWHKSWSGADGIVDPDRGTIEILASQGLHARSYSPTALQHFAACPYRFLLYAIHRLRVREEPVALEQLDPLTRGALYHEVQFQFFRELQAAGLLPVRPPNTPQVLDVADQVLNRVASKYEENLAPAIPRVWKAGVEEIRTDLRGWIHELARADGNWQPVHFEFAFGIPAGPDRDPQSTAADAVVLDGIRLRGSIDMIERDATRGLLRVTDHKTGKAPERMPRWIGGGELLQPLLYALAAEALLKEKVHSGLLYYATQRGNYTPVEIPLAPDARLRIERVLAVVDEAVQQGFLPAAPRPEGCQFCDYKLVCGPYEERRVKGKNKERLEALQELRNMP